MNQHEIRPPAVVFPDQRQPHHAYRTAHDLLARRAPIEALEVLEPALAEEPDNTGLRVLRAWAYFVRVQLGKAETELRALVESARTTTGCATPWAGAWSGRRSTPRRCRTCAWPPP